MRPARIRIAGALAFRITIAIGIAVPLAGCVGIDILKLFDLKDKNPKGKKGNRPKVDEEDDDTSDDEVQKTAVNLGDAVYPDGTKKPIAAHSWTTQKLEPKKYGLRYLLSKDEHDRVIKSHKDFADKVSFAWTAKNTFRWRPPPGCTPDFACAFGAMSDANSADLAPLVELFRQRQKESKLDAIQLADLIVTFVQNITYQEPEDQPFGILSPAAVVAENRGDCDSKSLLAHLLLRAFEIDSVMLSSKAHRHAMLGIALPATGHRKEFAGRSYAFTELTAKGSPIGHVNPSLLTPDDWVVVPTRWPNAGW